ncbi:MAG: hypothetical protein WC523_01720 [Patescibacteria group bacterium]|jgi:hypothetical protein
MGIFDWRRAENKIVNKTDRSFKKGKAVEKSYVPNQNIGKSEKMGIIEDEYTKAQRLEKLKSVQENQGDFFTDKDGNKFKISELNGQTKKLLQKAREDLKNKNWNNDQLKEADDPGDNFPPGGRLPHKLYQEEIVYPHHRDPKDNLKTLSPAKRRLNVKGERSAKEEIETMSEDDSRDIWSDLPDLPNN